jgi:hypothetical protein
MTKAQIEIWIHENARCNWGASMSTDDQDAVLALALEALELRVLVPTGEEIDAMCMGLGGRVAGDYIDRVRAYREGK